MFVTDRIKNVGVYDKKIDLFEGMYKVPDGIKYNSYVILDEKIAVLDAVDVSFKDEWLLNLKKALQGRKPDYLIVQHMEPDHSANILAFLKMYPEATIVSSKKAFLMMKQYFGTEFIDRRKVIQEGSNLNLGSCTLTFITAPMVHWPEVFVTYEKTQKVLFSADAFGKFGGEELEANWVCEARRYYFGIVGKYGIQVQNLLKKLSAYEIKIICPLHGPVLTENIPYYVHLYDTWSKYEAESEGVVIAYTSVYGNTKKAVKVLAEKIRETGGVKVVVIDLARCDMTEAVEDAFRYRTIVLATTTYNGEIFPFMREFINSLTERNFQNRRVGFIENGSWAPMAKKVMQQMLENCKNIRYTKATVKILSALNEESLEQINTLAKELSEE